MAGPYSPTRAAIRYADGVSFVCRRNHLVKCDAYRKPVS